jgi:UDP-N-acetylmuramoylalanine--D-glutamate ligase
MPTNGRLMEAETDLKGAKAVVLGAARSGMAAAAALRRHGAEVFLSDRKPLAELSEAVAKGAEDGFKVVAGGHPDSLLEGCRLLVLSPGVPGGQAFVKAARAQGVPVISEIELAFRLRPLRWVGVTGTNGKTTTTSLIHAMVQRSGVPALLGGNIGSPLADRVEDAEEGSLVVAELSSFQLEDVDTFKPFVGVWTNLTPDHQDRYADADAYAAAKARIFGAMDGRQHLVTNAMDEGVERACAAAKAVRWRFARGIEQAVGAWERGGTLWVREPGSTAKALLPLGELRLRGPHNLENALAASCAAAAVGLPLDAVAETLRRFEGVEHRLEPCGEVRKVGFINDSKGTNVDSVMKALQSFGEPVHLILGGRDKGGDFTALDPLVRAHVKGIYAIGEAAAKVGRQLKDAAPCLQCGDLATAMRRALASARAGEWVLLSPGCASFDQFRNYEHRGRFFKEQVAVLREESLR